MYIDFEMILVSIVSCWLAWHTYHYLEYKPIGRFFDKFFESCLYYVEFKSKIWIDKVIVLIVSSTIMMLIPFVLIFFWGVVITYPFYFIFGR